MIPKAHITAWRARAPWLADAQVEQDLIISRAIVEMFRVPEIAKQPRLPRRHRALQALPRPARQVLRGHRSGAGPPRAHR